MQFLSGDSADEQSKKSHKTNIDILKKKQLNLFPWNKLGFQSNYMDLSCMFKEEKGHTPPHLRACSSLKRTQRHKISSLWENDQDRPWLELSCVDSSASESSSSHVFPGWAPCTRGSRGRAGQDHKGNNLPEEVARVGEKTLFLMGRWA